MSDSGELAAQRAYQQVLLEEYDRHYPDGPENEAVGLDQPETLLTESEARDIVEGQEGSFEELVDDGWLVAYDDFDSARYRSTHFDLVYRVNHLRTQRPNDPSVLESFLSKEKELVPDFGREPLRGTLLGDNSILSEDSIQLLLDAFESAGSNYDVPSITTLSSHQHRVIKDLLQSDTKDMSLSAPTAAGKTISFLVPAIGTALEVHDSKPDEIASVLSYPRKSLARDQFMGAVSRIEQINQELPQDSELTIGIEDGDTKEGYENPNIPDEKNYEAGDSFRGYECIRTGCSGPLKVVGETEPKVACGDCDFQYDSIIPTEAQMHQEGTGPNILLTNPWILYNRILSPGQVDRFKSVEFYTFDEAHVYTNYQGGHVQYIIAHLRELSESEWGRPTCVFASATMSNPEVFVRELGALHEDDSLAYHDYEEVLEDTGGYHEERLLFRQYILPPPRQSVQALNQLVTEAVSLWSHRNALKTINFIDSVAEVNTQYSYVTDTILSTDEQGAAEVVRHIVDEDITGPSDHYNWETITPDLGPPDIDTYTDFATTTLPRSIERHFADLNEDVRSDIEDRFADGDLRFLFSTQTLELGIDLDDVAVVMQYKLPPGGNEGVIQRIGRAGRSRETQRVGLGIVTLSSKPASMLYMYDPEVRKKLESTEHLPPAKIGTSAAVQKQHLITRTIVNLAQQNHRTYFRGHSLTATDDLLDILGSIRSQLQSFDYETEDSVRALMERSSFKQHKTELLSHFDRIIDSSGSGDTESSVNPNELFSTIDRIYKEISQAQEGVRSIIKELRAIDGLEEPVLNLIEESEPLQILDEALEDLKRAVRKSWRSKDSQRINEWLIQYGDDYEEACQNIPTPKTLRNAVYFELFSWAESNYDDLDQFEEANNIDTDDLMNRLTQTVEELDASSRLEYERQLKTVIKDVRDLEDHDLRALSKRFAIQNFEGLDKGNFTNLYDALNVMFENSVRFTPLLQPPEPEFNMKVQQ